MALSGILLLLVASCSTAPEKPDRDILGWLPPESGLLMRLQVPENHELAKLLLSNAGVDPAEMEPVLNRALLVVVGMEAGPEGPVIHLATVGNWPRNMMGSALGKDWIKISRYYWKNSDGMELSLPTGDELILSSGKADIMLDRAESGSTAPVSSDSGDMPDPADLEIWMTEPAAFMESAGMLGSLGNVGDLIDRITISLRRSESGTYGMQMVLVPEEDKYASGLMRAMRLFLTMRFGLSPDETERALLSEMDAIVEAGSVIITIPGLSLATMESLLGEMGIMAQERE